MLDPPATDQRPSGLILPADIDDVSTGIVMDGNESGIPEGAVVYYHKGHATSIRDVRVIDQECIIAWEEA